MINYYCLQPIGLSSKFFLEVNFQEFNLSNNWVQADKLKQKDNYLNSRDVEALLKLIGMSDKDIYVSTKSNPIEFNESLNEINNNELFEGFNLNLDKSFFQLFCDKTFKCFFIIYVLSMEQEKDKKGSLEHLQGLHYKVRDQLVRDPIRGIEEVSSWVNKIEELVLSIVTEEKEVLGKDKITLEIVENTGYILSIYPDFSVNDDMKSRDFEAIKRDFITENHSIDQLSDEMQAFIDLSVLSIAENRNDSDYKIVFLGWRFSTLYGIDTNRSLEILPVLIKLQVLYFLLEVMYKPIISSLYKDVRFNNGGSELTTLLNLFDKFMIDFENLKFDKDVFIGTLKPYQFEVFQKIEEYWFLNKNYKSIDSTLSICQTSLSRKLEINNRGIQQKQSDILFVLAIIQVFSIIGLANDYFGLRQLDISKGDTTMKSLHFILVHYGFYFLVVMSVLLIIFAYSNKLKNVFIKVVNIFK